MSKYDEAMMLLDEQVGNKDGLISLSTIALEPGTDGKSRPADGIGENLGWVCDEKNAEMMTKLRTVLAAWYHEANTDDGPKHMPAAHPPDKGALERRPQGDQKRDRLCQ